MDGLVPVPVALTLSEPAVCDAVVKQEELILPDIEPYEGDERMEPATSSYIKEEPCESMNDEEDELENPFQCFACGLDCDSQRELIEHFESEHTSNDQSTIIHAIDGTNCKMKAEDVDDDPLIGDEAPVIMTRDGKVQNIGQALGGCDLASPQEWMHSCLICGFTSTDRQDIASHMETHVLVQPLNCLSCKYIFSDSYPLKDYVRTNESEKPYACPHCSFRIEWLQNLKNHCFTHHVSTPGSNEHHHVDGSSLDQPITASLQTMQQRSPVMASVQNSVHSNHETSVALPAVTNCPTGPNIVSSGQQNGYYVVLKNCRSNGQFLGDLTIPANPLLVGNNGAITTQAPSNSDMLKHLLASNSMNEMARPLLQSPNYRNMVLESAKLKEIAPLAPIKNIPLPSSVALPKLAPKDNVALLSKASLHQNMPLVTTTVVPNTDSVSTTRDIAPLNNVSLLQNEPPHHNPPSVTSVVKNTDARPVMRTIAPRQPGMPLPPNLPTVIPNGPLVSTVKRINTSSKEKSKPRKANGMPRGKTKRRACTYCEYVARDTWNLKTHMLTHTRERPFACPHCSYRASQAAHLRKHLLIHERHSSRS